MHDGGVVQRFRLDGRVAIVVGASSGLGEATAGALAEAGARLVLAARRPDRLESVRATLAERGAEAVAVRADVTLPEDCEAIVREAMTRFGRVDVLVNSAGMGTAVPASRETPDEFRSVIEANLNAAYWMSQSFGRAVTEGGSIINIGSVVGITTLAKPQAAYTASKLGLIGLTRDLAQQWGARRGIRVNCIAPGIFPTEMSALNEAEYVDWLVERTVLKRLGRPDEIASVALWLASDASSYVTGQTIVVDGGMVLT